MLAFFLAACKDEPEISHENQVQDHSDELWADSILGGLTEAQKYFQHIIVEVPSNYQNALDSLSKWIVANQPGAIYFSGWDADSVQRIKACLDTQDIVQPFFFASYFESIGAKPYPFWQVNKQNRRPEFTQFFGKAGYGLLNFELNVSPEKTNLAWLDTLSKKHGLVPVVANYDDRNVAEEFDEFITTLKTSGHAVLINLQMYDTVSF